MDPKETNEEQEQQQQPPHGTPSGSSNRNAAALTAPTSTSPSMQQRLTVGALSLRPPLGLDGSQFGNEQRARGRPRGRPRKCATPDVNGASASSSGTSPAKRLRVLLSRPPAYGLGGTSFTPYIINVNAGEDIAAKVGAFMNQEASLEVCVLSVTGSVSIAVLIHSTDPNNPSGVITYEGLYEILSLTASFSITESNGTVNRTSNLRVTLAGLDGRVMGGSVAGVLVAGSRVQVVVGSFVPEREIQSAWRVENNTGPASATTSVTLSGGGPGGPQSQGVPRSSESSEGNDSKSQAGNNPQ